MDNIEIINYVDLFCGLGAFHLAFDKCSTENKKYICKFACDIDSKVRKIYKENHNIKPKGDINNIDISKIPEFDILCAGFPCQPFSIAGKKEGFSDKNKGNLFFKILEIIDAKNPSKIILENVKNLHTIHKGETFKIIIKELTNRGYHTSFKIIDSKYYDCPQSRKRIYIICCKDKPYIFVDKKLKIKPVSDIIDHSENNFLNFKDKYDLHKCANERSMMIYKLINKKTGKGGRQGERIYSIKNCGPTICASSGGPGAKTGLYLIDKKIRTLNVKEALRMFGFPETYKYSSLENEKKMLFYLGNSIVVNVLEELITSL